MTVLEAAQAGPLLAPYEVARQLGVSGQAVRQWLAAGRLPCITTPLGRLVRAEDLEAFARVRAARGRAGSHAGHGPSQAGR